MTIPRTRHRTTFRLMSAVFGGGSVKETVISTVRLDADPASVWNRLMFYEEVPRRPAWLLRVLLPRPVRTEGDKQRIGAIVRCVYTGGHLAKRITAVEEPCVLGFEVVEQRLGIEGCIITESGSYHIDDCGCGTKLALTTNYQAYLRPRSLWRHVEALLVNQLHRHILSGITAAVLPHHSALRAADGKTSTPPKTRPGALV
jgi:hypothetical protein